MTRKFRRTRSKPGKLRRSTQGRRLICESLEDRRLLATVAAPEFLVNDSTPDFQYTYAETRSVAGNASGDHIVVFGGVGPGDDQGIFARRFDATSTPQGSQFLVNETTISNQRHPSVAMGAGGESVVVWSGVGVGDLDIGVYARLYDNTGASTTGEIKVSETTPSLQQKPVVAKAPDGSFVVTWSGKGVGDDLDSGVFARRFASDGTPLTGELRVNATTLGNQQEPDVAIGGDGRFVITWSGAGPGDSSGVFFQRFDATGNAVGVETRVNTKIQDSISGLLPALQPGDSKIPLVTVTSYQDFPVVPPAPPTTTQAATSWLAANWRTLALAFM